jgi:putative transcriptional regulator
MAATGPNSDSAILATVHRIAAGPHKAGLIDKATMREFDALMLKQNDEWFVGLRVPGIRRPNER